MALFLCCQGVRCVGSRSPARKEILTQRFLNSSKVVTTPCARIHDEHDQ